MHHNNLSLAHRWRRYGLQSKCDSIVLVVVYYTPKYTAITLLIAQWKQGKRDQGCVLAGHGQHIQVWRPETVEYRLQSSLYSAGFVCASQPYRHYILRRIAATGTISHTATLVHPICAERFHKTLIADSGQPAAQPAPWRDHYYCVR